MKGFLKSLISDFKTISGCEGGYVWMIPAAMAAIGAITAKNKETQARKMNKAAATQTEFSPWTGMGKGQMVDGGAGALAGGIQGGIAGMGMAQGMGGGQQGGMTNDKWSSLQAANNKPQMLQQQGAQMTSGMQGVQQPQQQNRWSLGGNTSTSLYS